MGLKLLHTNEVMVQMIILLNYTITFTQDAKTDIPEAPSMHCQ